MSEARRGRGHAWIARELVATERTEQAREHPIVRARDRDEAAVARAVVIVRNRALGAGADALAHVPGAAVHGDRIVENPEHRLVETDVHHLPLPAALRVAQRDQRADGREHAREVVGHGRRARRHGRTIGIARQIGEAADGPGDAPEAGTIAVRSGLPVRGHAHHDQRGPDGRQRVPSEVPPLEGARAEVLGDDRRAADETADQRLPLGIAQVARDRLLVARLDEPPVGVAPVSRTAEAPQVVAHARLLHLDHLGAELAEQRRADGRREERGEVEHGDAGEGRGAVGHRPTLLESAHQDQCRLPCASP